MSLHARFAPQPACCHPQTWRFGRSQHAPSTCNCHRHRHTRGSQTTKQPPASVSVTRQTTTSTKGVACGRQLELANPHEVVLAPTGKPATFLESFSTSSPHHRPALTATGPDVERSTGAQSAAVGWDWGVSGLFPHCPWWEADSVAGTEQAPWSQLAPCRLSILPQPTWPITSAGNSACFAIPPPRDGLPAYGPRPGRCWPGCWLECERQHGVVPRLPPLGDPPTR